MSTTTSASLLPRWGASPSLSVSLPPMLPPAHHAFSPFSRGSSSQQSTGVPPPPPLLPAGHLFTSTIDSAAGASTSYRADSLFPQHTEYKKHPDFRRRELDTRFLASQDHSIPIPPPPYMQSEQQMQGPFIGPPPLEVPMVSQQGPSHMIGLSSYPSVSPLFAPGGGASTPFVPPAHLSALQPKKPDRWCAMHVWIAWGIYNHQQAQKQAEADKAGMALVNNPTDQLHAANHQFSSLPQTHDMSPFSGPLLSAASHSRFYDAVSHHSTFLNPTPAHIGPFASPDHPSFAGGMPGFSGLGPLGSTQNRQIISQSQRPAGTDVSLKPLPANPFALDLLLTLDDEDNFLYGKPTFKKKPERREDRNYKALSRLWINRKTKNQKRRAGQH